MRTLVACLCLLISVGRAGAQPDAGYDLDNLPVTIFDPDITKWKIDRFAGNDLAGSWFYQGPAREVGGIQQVRRAVHGADGIYLSVYRTRLPNEVPTLLKVDAAGKLSLFMEPEGLVEGPVSACQAGVPFWNPHQKALYLTGPNCLRRVVTREDGTRHVEVVAGTPNTPGATDGPALKATLQKGLGAVFTADGAIYWLESPSAVRKIHEGSVSTLKLTRPETPGHLFNSSLGGALSLGENEDTLYLSDVWGGPGPSVLRLDIKTGVLSRAVGLDGRNDVYQRAGRETDGPALTHVGFCGSAYGMFDPFYRAIWLWGNDHVRFRWLRLEGDGWARTIFGAVRPESGLRPLELLESNDVGMLAERFTAGSGSAIQGPCGMDSAGGLYVGACRNTAGVWRAYDSTRAGPPPLAPVSAPPGGGSRIYLARLGSEGQLLAGASQLAASAVGIQQNPRVAFHAGVFLVVWQDSRNGNDDDVLAARVAPTGEVLDKTPLAVATGARTQTMPDVAADDEGFMVVWHGFQGADKFPRVFAARVGADGSVGKAVAVGDGASPRIAWNGTHHLVVSSGVYLNAKEVSTDAKAWVRISKAPSALPVDKSWIYGHAGPNRYGVCAMPPQQQGWTLLVTHHPPSPWGGTGALRAINITPEGKLEPSSPTAASGVWIEGGKETPANWLDSAVPDASNWPWGALTVAPEGQHCVAVWQRYQVKDGRLTNSDLQVARVDGWVPVDLPGVALAADPAEERNPALAGSGAGTMLAVYEKHAAASTRIMGRPLTIGSSIKVGAEVTIRSDDTGGPRRASPAVAFAPAGSGTPAVFLVVWQEGWHGVDAVTPPLPPPADGGGPADGTAADGGQSPRPKSEGCGCAAGVHSGGSLWPACLLMLLSILAALRPKRKR